MKKSAKWACGIDPGCNNGRTLWIYLGPISRCTHLHLDILQIPFFPYYRDQGGDGFSPSANHRRLGISLLPVPQAFLAGFKLPDGAEGVDKGKFLVIIRLT